MSQPSRPQARGPASRRRRELRIDAITPLEDRCLLAPVVSISPRLAAYTANATLPAGTNAGGVTVTLGQPDTGFPTAAAFTTVNQLTPISSFGGDIVTIQAGPGGVFGNGVYAISRGAGENAASVAAADTSGVNTAPVVSNAVNRPGVIYRVDPATGKTSVFFDLNTVVSQIDTTPGSTAANSVGAATGLVNWYSITFDPEGYFNGKPSMLVSSVDRADPAKNAIYQIAPDGTFLGAFAYFTDGQSALKFNVNPSSILIPPVEDQTFLRGLLAGGGVSSTGGTFAALFFNANAFTPNQNLSTTTLPAGVSQTGMTLGPIVGMTAANADYSSRVYSIFTDFGTPAAGGIPATDGFSGVQGLNGELLISNVTGGTGTTGLTIGNINSTFSEIPSPANNTSTDSTIGDRYGELPTDYRRFQSIAFDQYGYFSQGANLNSASTSSTTSTTGSTLGTGAGGGSGTGVGLSLGAGAAGLDVVNNVLTRPGITLPPANAGSLFVADLGTGLSVPVSVPNTTPAATIRVPVQGPEFISVVNPTGSPADGSAAVITVTPAGPGLGGRIVRITANGQVSNFAENFHTSNNTDSSGFALSSLSITFSADGTTLYAADDDGIWQFKTVASLAGSDTGSLIGLNDLRSLGVPYDGANSAVAVIDTGVDALSTPFRGRVAGGTNIFTNGFGNDDTSTFGTGTTTTTGGAGGGSTGASSNPAPLPTVDGHGTPVAGVIAQFVPQATIVPVDVFAPFLASSSANATTTGGGGTNGNGTTATLITANSNTLTSSQYLYQGLNYVTTHPFVNDPVRPGQTDRVIAAEMGFGTTETFVSETGAYKRYPQIVIAFKNQMRKFRSLGIAPIAATGQFGAPFGAGVAATGTNGGTTGGTTGGGTTGSTGGTASIGQANNNSENSAVGDVNGIAFPAILNEVISVTGDYPFPFSTGPSTPPTNPATGVIPRPLGPVLIFGNNVTIGGNAGATSSGSGGTSTNTSTTTTNGVSNIIQLLTNADTSQYTGRILGSANRNVTTDFVAPALDVPTFRRTFLASATSTAGSGTTTGTSTTSLGDATNHMTFQDGGTSLSSALVTGAYALVSSALGYWTSLNQTGTTSSAYLNMPVGSKTLNFGAGALKDLTAYNNPDGINSILQWTAIPRNDPNDGTSASTPPNSIGSGNFQNYSELNVGNAIASIEASVALNYLISHNDVAYLDPNNSGRITAQSIQTFVDNANKMGLPEAGAMAALLGGTARIPTNPTSNGTENTFVTNGSTTVFGETPDQPDVLQRRFNYLDYAAHGNLTGSISIVELRELAANLLPAPDAFVINDRQRSSINGYLLAPDTQRNYHDLLHISPKFQFIPKGALAKFRNVTPAMFKVNRGERPSASIFPVYTLYGGSASPASNNTTKTPTVTASSTSATSGTGQTSPTAVTTTPVVTGTMTNGTIKTTTPTTGTTTPTSTSTSTPTSTSSTTTGTGTTSGTGTTTGTGSSVAQLVANILQNSSTTNTTNTGTTTTPTIASGNKVAPVSSSTGALPQATIVSSSSSSADTTKAATTPAATPNPAPATPVATTPTATPPPAQSTTTTPTPTPKKAVAKKDSSVTSFFKKLGF